MSSLRDPIVIGDDDYVENMTEPFHRSMSVASLASSCTLYAESPVTKISSTMQRQCASELMDEAGRRLRADGMLLSRCQNEQPWKIPNTFRVVVDLKEDELRGPQDSNKEDEIIDVGALELKLEEEIFEEHQPRTGQRFAAFAAGPRNPPIVLPFLEIAAYKWRGFSLKEGQAVELEDGSFLKIKTIIKNLQTDELTLRGWKLKRSTRLEKQNGMVPKKLNELVFIFEVDLDDFRHYLEQSVVEVSLKDILRIRQLVCTNYPFPMFRFNKELLPIDTTKETKEYIKNFEVLVVRYRIMTKFDNARVRLESIKKPNNYNRCEIEILCESECTTGHSMSASVRRLAWRGNTILGGSGTKRKLNSERQIGQAGNSGKEPIFIDLLENCDLETENITSKQHHCFAPQLRRIYTYGDTFSGGGGSMKGASMAGLKLIFGTDFNPICCATLRANFPDVKVYEKWAHEFVVMRGEQYVDILHLSPPCQVFSPVHTRPGPDDEMNFASLFAVEELIKKLKPRMVTLEQTFGILHDRFRPAFNLLIRMFIDAGYSVVWRVVRFADFGLAQSRRRLIIVAAGPGEILPKLPASTHSEQGGNGLKPWTSVREVLRNIPRNAAQHDTRAAAAKPLANWRPWDDSSIVRCITTNGGDYNCHPSGLRSLTNRELAALQGFPHEHVFTGQTAGAIKKQIGNAFPPVIVKILLESIRKHLERVDAAEERRSGGY